MIGLLKMEKNYKNRSVCSFLILKFILCSCFRIFDIIIELSFISFYKKKKKSKTLDKHFFKGNVKNIMFLLYYLTTDIINFL